MKSEKDFGKSGKGSDYSKFNSGIPEISFRQSENLSGFWKAGFQILKNNLKIQKIIRLSRIRQMNVN